MLAYVFWHRPAAGVKAEEYEQAQRGFHAELEIESGCFRLSELPFAAADGDGATAGGERDGYEDWYLVEDWAGLGELNEVALDARRRPSHDRAAALSGAGWGAVYRLLAGPAEVPASARWLDRPRGLAAADARAALGDPPAWQRQLVLGPAPELCLAVPAEDGGAGRTRIC